jgi:hypothetical protein
MGARHGRGAPDPPFAPRAGVAWGLYEGVGMLTLSARLPGSDDGHDFVPRRPSVLGPDTECVRDCVDNVHLSDAGTV